MDRDELLQRLDRMEWDDFECKRARGGVPNDAYKSVSAFANTSGGWIVLGVSESDGNFIVSGLNDPDQIQNGFLGAIRSGEKFSQPVEVNAELFEIGGETVIGVEIGENPRHQKPVYLNGNTAQTFVRSGGGDHRCTSAELERFLRDSAGPYDGGVLTDLDPESFFDQDSVRYYRRNFRSSNTLRDESLTDLEFLNERGLVLERDGALVPTRAATLLFGTVATINSILPRPIADIFWHDSEIDGDQPEERFSDRLVLEESNLIQAWMRLLDRYQEKNQSRFTIDPNALTRDDNPPDYISFREAAINLLIHQDFGDSTRHAVIRFFNDGILFRNPGDSFAPAELLIEPGNKEVRNPQIALAFRRIGLSEQAGSGVPEIMRQWRKEGRVPPIIDNDRSSKQFSLVLRDKLLISEEQTAIRASLGATLDPDSAKLFFYALESGLLRFLDAKTITGFSTDRVQGVLNRLVVNRLLVPTSKSDHPNFSVSPHLLPQKQDDEQAEVAVASLVTDQAADESENLVSDQAVTMLTTLANLTENQKISLNFCDIPKTRQEIMDRAGVSHRNFFNRNTIRPLLDAGLLQMTIPENPTDPNQKYVLTESGIEWKAAQLGATGGS
jgi:ATP-dependent DNA helicase RecG